MVWPILSPSLLLVLLLGEQVRQPELVELDCPNQIALYCYRRQTIRHPSRCRCLSLEPLLLARA